MLLLRLFHHRVDERELCQVDVTTPVCVGQFEQRLRCVVVRILDNETKRAVLPQRKILIPILKVHFDDKACGDGFDSTMAMHVVKVLLARLEKLGAARRALCLLVGQASGPLGVLFREARSICIGQLLGIISKRGGAHSRWPPERMAVHACIGLGISLPSAAFAAGATAAVAAAFVAAFVIPVSKDCLAFSQRWRCLPLAAAPGKLHDRAAPKAAPRAMPKKLRQKGEEIADFIEIDREIETDRYIDR